MELRSRGNAEGADGALASLIVCGDSKRMKQWKWLLAAVAMALVVVVGLSVFQSVQEGAESQAEQWTSLCNGCKFPIPNSAGCKDWCGPI